MPHILIVTEQGSRTNEAFQVIEHQFRPVRVAPGDGPHVEINPIAAEDIERQRAAGLPGSMREFEREEIVLASEPQLLEKPEFGHRRSSKHHGGRVSEIPAHNGE